MTSTEEVLTERQVASGASNRVDDFTDSAVPADSAGTSSTKNPDRQDVKSQKSARLTNESPVKERTSKISENDIDRHSVGKQSRRLSQNDHEETSPMTSSTGRAPPEGRDRSVTPLPPLTTTEAQVNEESDEDDGGWKGKIQARKGKEVMSLRPRRGILQDLPRSRREGEQTLPQPMSNNLVIRNGRLPASWQQSTLFKNVKGPKFSASPRSAKLPALSAREPKLTTRSLPAKLSARQIVQTTFRAAEYQQRTAASGAKQKPKQKLSKSETNYIRLAKMVARVGSDLLRLAFYNYLERQQPPRKLYQFLATNKRRLKNFSLTYKLLARRWDIMYPDDDETKSSLQKLDSALLFWFLRYICTLKRPNDFIWKRKPLSEDLSETADIARIRDSRNFLINLSSPALYDDEYERKVEELKQITMRICDERQGEELVGIIDDMKTSTIRYSERDQYLEVLNHWADETEDRQIAPAKQSGEDIRERKEMTTRFLQMHRNPKVFVRTKIFQKAQDKLTKNGFVVLKGNIGDGKTTTAIALMVAKFDEDECLLVTSPDQWQFIEPRTVSAILLDDIFGSGSLDEQLLAKWETKFEQIHECCLDTNERTGVRVIITIRQNIFEQCYSKLSPYKLFAKGNIVDCSTDEIQVTEKKNMLAKHLVAADKNVPKSEIDKGAKAHNSKLGFPQCCALFVSRDAFMIIGSQFFERPIELLFEQLDKLYDGDKYGYLGLVVLMFQKDAILFKKRLEEFKDEAFRTKFLDLAFLCKVPISDHISKFTLEALDSQLKPFVSYYKEKQCYTFVHESIMEAVMASFGERHPQEVLEGCSLPFLMDFVGTDANFDEKPDEIFMMRVKKENFLVLAKVFEHYILNGEVKRISQHRAMKDLRFVQFFFEYLQQSKHYEKIILSEDANVQESKESRRRVGFLYGAIDQEVPNIELATAIIATGIHAKKPFKPKWCEAELEAALCMAVQRGSYDIYKELVETGIEPPDQLMMDAKYLTSVDIMRDLLTRRHWSDEQKDIALVRASRGVKPESQEICTLLLQDHASVNSIRAGTTALCEAVKSGKLKTVTLLLTSGASVDDRDATQQTPLHHACDWNNIEVVKILLKKSADVNAKDGLGFTPFLVAAGWGRETIMEHLLTKRVDVLAMDDQENNVLHICAANGQAKIIKMLMTKYPVEMDSILIARNRHGWTPLDFSLRCGHLSATKLLIQTILKKTNLKTQPKTFVHTRFFVVKLEDFNVDEKFQYRFLDDSLGRTCFQMPRCNWFIQAGNRDEYEEVRTFALKYESKLRQCLAKS